MRSNRVFALTTITLLAALGACGDDVEPERFFYYYFEEKIYITQDRHSLFIKVDSADKAKVISQVSSIPGYAISQEWNMNDIFSMNARLNSSNQERELGFAVVRAIPEVLSANYVYRTERNGFIGLVDEFVVMVGETTTEEQFQEYIAQYDIAEGPQSYHIEGRHIFTVPKDGPYTVLDIANRFQESGLFKYAEPVMYMEFNLN